MRILLGYASEHGSTAGIAARLAELLRAYGHTVDLRPLDRGGPAAAGYDAFVLGSAVHSGAWLAGAADYLRSNRELLRSRPLWLFSVGMIRAAGGRLARLEPVPGKLRQLAEDLRPVEHYIFAGALHPDHFRLPGRLVYRMLGGRYGDFRDWGEVDAWAEVIGLRLAEARHGF